MQSHCGLAPWRMNFGSTQFNVTFSINNMGDLPGSTNHILLMLNKRALCSKLRHFSLTYPSEVFCVHCMSLKFQQGIYYCDDFHKFLNQIYVQNQVIHHKPIHIYPQSHTVHIYCRTETSLLTNLIFCKQCTLIVLLFFSILIFCSLMY